MIVYREYLPLLFGYHYDTYIGDYTGYDPSVDATVPHSFAMQLGDLVIPCFIQKLTDMIVKESVFP